MFINIKRMIAVIVILDMCIVVQQAAASVLYSNDLGTSTQTAVFSVEGNGTPVYMDASSDVAYSDLDGDGLYRWVQNGYGNIRLVKTYFAPPFKILGNLAYTANGNETGTALNDVFIQVSNDTGLRGDARDGYSWDYIDHTTNGSSTSEPLSSSPGTDAGYNGIKEVSTRMWVGRTSTSTIDPYGGQMRITGDLSDAKSGNVWIWKNDFGTAVQQSAGSGADNWTTISESSNITYADRSYDDNDNDNLAERATKTGYASTTVYFTKRIVAPSGTFFGNVIATGLGASDKANYSTFAQLQLSVDGIDWNIMSDLPVGGSQTYDMVADSTDNSDYDQLTEVWLRIKMYRWATYGNSPWASDIKVSADIVIPPGTLIIIN